MGMDKLALAYEGYDYFSKGVNKADFLYEILTSSSRSKLYKNAIEIQKLFAEVMVENIDEIDFNVFYKFLLYLKKNNAKFKVSLISSKIPAILSNTGKSKEIQYIKLEFGNSYCTEEDILYKGEKEENITHLVTRKITSDKICYIKNSDILKDIKSLDEHFYESVLWDLAEYSPIRKIAKKYR